MVLNVILFLLLAVCAATAVYCRLSLSREARGLEIHAHSDGTVHEHHRGSVSHTHPTFSERHERVLARLFRESGRRSA